VAGGHATLFSLVSVGGRNTNSAPNLAIVPVDCPYEQSEAGIQGMIRDNELKEILVESLPIGCHLTVRNASSVDEKILTGL
jgi:hypothetical protein